MSEVPLYGVHVKAPLSERYPTEGSSWGYPMIVLGAVCSFLEPFCEHLSPKIDKVSKELTLRYPHEGPCVACKGWGRRAPCPTC